MSGRSKVLALSGGVGGAKLATGLASVLPVTDLLIVTNTGDDFEHLGLTICPDLDSVMYALAGLNDRQRGWGLAQESWTFLAALENLGGPSWFQLGDKDLATHVQRSHLLRQGFDLTAVTASLCDALNISHHVLPMSNDSVKTMVVTADEGELDFQRYFVAYQCQPVVQRFYFSGIEQAAPQAAMMDLLQTDSALEAVIICPSNPFVSVDPILSLPAVRKQLMSCGKPVVAVSPLIAGQALKGPAAKMMQELNMPCDAFGVAQYYQGLLSHFVIDSADAELRGRITDLGMEVLVCDTIMRNKQQQTDLAARILQSLGIGHCHGSESC